MEINLVAEGLKFMVLGMVTVFLFLVVMVLILNFQSFIIQKMFPKSNSTAKRGSLTPVPNTSSDKKGDKALIAAITVAIQTFKNSKT